MLARLRYRCLGVVWVLAGLAAAVLCPGNVVGEDFCVENQVFVGGEREPRSQSVTIFYQGTIYDFLDDPAEIVVLSDDGHKFVLLDPARRVRAEVSDETVESFVRQRCRAAADHREPSVRFQADVRLEEDFDESSGRLTLSSRWVAYRLTLDGVGESIAQQYRRFADAYCRLNAMLHPDARPPSARLLVNAAVAKYQAIATDVRLTLKEGDSVVAKDTSLRSEHRLVGQVVGPDLDRVRQTREFMAIYRLISYEQYAGGISR